MALSTFHIFLQSLTITFYVQFEANMPNAHLSSSLSSDACRQDTYILYRPWMHALAKINWIEIHFRQSQFSLSKEEKKNIFFGKLQTTGIGWCFERTYVPPASPPPETFSSILHYFWMAHDWKCLHWALLSYLTLNEERTIEWKLLRANFPLLLPLSRSLSP